MSKLIVFQFNKEFIYFLSIYFGDEHLEDDC